MFRSLHSKLVVSYLLLAFVVLLLSALAVGVIITRVQRQVNLLRAQSIAVSLANRVKTQPGLLAPRSPWLERLRQDPQLDGRVLVLNRRGEVIIDSEGSYVGEQIPPERARALASPLPPNVRRHTFTDGQEYFLLLVDLPENVDERLAGRRLALAIPVRQVDPPWRSLWRPLLIVAAITGALATGLSFLLAHSITRPVKEMAIAAEEIARGRYEQHIQARGRDEIATLAARFSHMANEVARTQRGQRDFLANVSHDLKTPLTSIQGFSQAILEGAITDEQGYRRAAEIIHGEAERMLRLVQDLVELARLESGELDLAPEPMSLEPLVRTEAERIQERCREAGIALHVRADGSLPPVVADAHRLRQALANVIDNAVKYSASPGEVTIEMAHWAAGAPHPKPLAVSFGEPRVSGEWVYITVHNRGEPIPPNDLSRVFDRFYRVDRSRRRSEGSGLGLAIVRETMLAHGGAVEIDSSAEEGTRLRLWLPVANTRQDAADAKKRR
ncbi:MAG: HAMP domain-containing histidine kinase [Chloroflexi bacterium]|nr:HAMP domain-containing histidine kinase [Chloroflexota bacterium]